MVIIPTKLIPIESPRSNPDVNSPKELSPLPKNIYIKYKMFPKITKDIPYFNFFFKILLFNIYYYLNYIITKENSQ